MSKRMRRPRLRSEDARPLSRAGFGARAVQRCRRGWPAHAFEAEGREGGGRAPEARTEWSEVEEAVVEPCAVLTSIDSLLPTSRREVIPLPQTGK